VDNKTYYLMNENGTYSNYSACGNTLNCNNPIVRNFILDSLRYWVSEYHIDGFRVDEAPIFARGQDGKPMVSPPLVESLKNDPVLNNTKLISEGWDAAGFSTIGQFPTGWADWNPRMRDTVKRFVKGMAEAGPELISSIEGSPDMFGNSGPDSSINYINSHDGFTMYDTVAYNSAHNEGNCYTSPMDNEFDNCSWNCGVEGETEDPEVNALRHRQIKNIMTILMLSRGVPMFWAGDEFGNTQYGNNNAFCQDTIVSWLDWNRLEKYRDVFQYVKTLIAFRKEHPVIRKADYFNGHNSLDYPELSWHGEKPWCFDRNQPFLTFGVMYSEAAADFGTQEDCFIYLAYNAHWEEHSFELPIIPEGMRWSVVLYSADTKMETTGTKVENRVNLLPRSSMLLIGKRE
jgi:glycogen operon protein